LFSWLKEKIVMNEENAGYLQVCLGGEEREQAGSAAQEMK
jgi:hypothetical protein